MTSTNWAFSEVNRLEKELLKCERSQSKTERAARAMLATLEQNDSRLAAATQGNWGPTVRRALQDIRAAIAAAKAAGIEAQP